MVRIDVEAAPGAGAGEGYVRVVVAPTPRIEAALAAPGAASPPVVLHLDLDEAERVRDRLLRAIDALKDRPPRRTAGVTGA